MKGKGLGPDAIKTSHTVMKRLIDYSLYLVTDRKLAGAVAIEDAVAAAIRGGCTIVQLREKDVSSLEFLELALRVKAVADSFGIPLIINDRVDIALAADASGAHVGPSDLPAREARRLLGPDKILGVSASSAAAAREAEEAGADYLGVGSMFPTSTKPDAKHTPIDAIRDICAGTRLPVVAIGGVNAKTAPQLDGVGISGFAVVSGILCAAEIEAAARELRSIFERGRGIQR
jgi:thiamine-phosphate pyrophosphorylase